MNRTEWEASNDPLLMLDWLRERGSERKFQLFVCACVRRILHIFVEHDIEVIPTLEYAERVADGLPSEALPPGRGLGAFGDPKREQLCAIVVLLPQLEHVAEFLGIQQMARGMVKSALILRLPQAVGPAALLYPDRHHPENAKEGRAEAAILRDLFGHLFHANPLWMSALHRTNEVERLARTIYEERSFADMPVLGDALEDAGCIDEEVLEHCRAGGEHARGCWVVDAILGQS